MSRRGKKALASSIFLYVGLIAAAVFVGQTGSAASRDAVSLSPVVIGGEAPALTINSLVKRSDI